MTAMNLKNHFRRSNPFLQGSWFTGLNTYQNKIDDSAILSQKHHGSFSDDDDAPPPKRRRLESPDSMDVDHLLASPLIRNGDLKIDVFRLMHKDTKKVRGSQQNPVVPHDAVATKAICRITVADVSRGWPRVLHCQSQVCELKTHKNQFGPHRLVRIDLPRPFYVPRESIFVDYPHDDILDLAEAYQLTIELEPAGSASWPPLDTRDLGQAATGLLSEAAPRCWIMSSEFDRVYGTRVKSPLRLAPDHQPQQQWQATDYVMDVELRWNTGIKARIPDKDLKACITAIDPDAEPFTNGHFEPLLEEVDGVNGINGINGINGVDGVNGVNGVNAINGINGTHQLEEPVQEPEEDLPEGDQTPSRALRTREKNKIYNLKVLSDQAQGKERKPRGRPPQQPAAAPEGQVVYYLPTDQPVCLDLFRCMMCSRIHQSLTQLQLHLQTVHFDWDILFDQSSLGTSFRILRRADPPLAQPLTQTYQLGRPQMPFVLSSFVAGDHSWITSRLGPDNTEELPRSPSRRSTASRNAPERPSSRGQPAAQRRVEATKHKKVTVPTTTQPLFDPVSKRRLQPGEEVPQPVPETAWLLHKHREFLNDYGDMTDNEQEFIKRWDRFILQQNLTCSAYFPRAWIAFVRQEASWLVASHPRMVEYSKHVSVLLARDVLDDEIVREAMSLIAKARKPIANDSMGDIGIAIPNETPKQSPRTSLIRRGANGCQVCQLPVMGPRMLCCSNKLCERRLYHNNCIQDRAIMPVTQRNWLCNSCIQVNGAS